MAGAVLPLLVLSLAISTSDCGGPTAMTPAAPSSVQTPTPKSGANAQSPRDHALQRAILGPWWGSGCPTNGDCGCGTAETLAEEFACQMDELRAADIPVSLYLFDGGGWSERDSRVTGACEGEGCCSWNLGQDVVDRLASEHVRALVHFWGGCHEREQYQRVHGQIGGPLLGFYLDDGSSDQELQRATDFMRSVAPDDFEVVAKSHQSREPSTTDTALSRFANVAYVGDAPNDFEGLRDAVSRVFEKARLIPAPLNELTGYDYKSQRAPDEETFHRRIHWGAFQPIMAHTPFGNSDPWRSEYSPELLRAYRYYAWLHRQLVPYFLSYARRMHEQPESPIIQPGPGPYAMRVGEEIFVAMVTSKAPSIDIQLPAGQWIDYWDEERVVSGNLVEYPAPAGREPVFLRLGAIIPMEVERGYTGHGARESAGSLTVLVYPSGTSSFRYFNDHTGTWTTFRSVVEGERLTLTADSSPGWPVLYRVGRIAVRPASVSINGQTVSINQSGGPPEAGSVDEVHESSTGAWFYDAASRRLIVKVVP